MFCIYCGSQTDNETKICDNCAQAHQQPAPFTPEVAPVTEEVAPAPMTEETAGYTPNVDPQAWANFQYEAPQAPISEEPIAPPPAPIVNETANPQPNGFVGEPLPQPTPYYAMPQQAPQAQQPVPQQGPRPVSPFMQGPDSKEAIRVLKECMSSFPAMMTAILMSAALLFTMVNFIISSGGNAAGIVIPILTVGITQGLLVAGAWISYLSAKGPNEVPITAGLKMANAIGVVYTVLMGFAIASFLVIALILAAAGSVMAAVGAELGDFFGPILPFVTNMSMAIVILIIVVCIIFFVMFIIFYAHCNKNLGLMKNILLGRTKNIHLSFFPVFWLYFIAVGNIFNVINSIDVLISGRKLSELTNIPMLTSPVSAVFAGLIALCTIGYSVFAAMAMNKTRKELKNLK